MRLLSGQRLAEPKSKDLACHDAMVGDQGTLHREELAYLLVANKIITGVKFLVKISKVLRLRSDSTAAIKPGHPPRFAQDDGSLKRATP